ncbi:nesprin-1-like protein [Lates japonicus]|uniref:Nesprin-1-like protein n=1 Tax=Lates japonicus TaxID=270547 RepID=A0AAD3NKY0_LATJO|nr:nesprin-1-like protein [Lates japonicus]
MSSQRPHENRRESRRSLGYKMARRAGGEASPKKNTSLNLVTGFYHYLRECERRCVCVRALKCDCVCAEFKVTSSLRLRGWHHKNTKRRAITNSTTRPESGRRSYCRLRKPLTTAGITKRALPSQHLTYAESINVTPREATSAPSIIAIRCHTASTVHADVRRIINIKDAVTQQREHDLCLRLAKLTSFFNVRCPVQMMLRNRPRVITALRPNNIC